MKILISGATGLVGSALVSRLWNGAHSLILLSRQLPKERARSRTQWLRWEPGVQGQWQEALDGVDGVINLAGEPIAGKRWSGAQKDKLWSSRIDATEGIVAAIAKARDKPKFLINASAVGYYGARGNEVITETSSAGMGFLADLCGAWEASALKAEGLGVRVALLRTGIVLAKGQGALAKMVPPFKFFAGGPLGTGMQWMPWIHLEDEIGLIEFLMQNNAARGPFNATAPNPVTMEEFCRAIGRAINRPSWATVPPSVLALLLGEMSDMLLTGQKALPEAALRLGFRFKFGKIDDALGSLGL